jgi:O-methyltransferase
MIKTVYFLFKEIHINILYRKLKRLLPKQVVRWVNSLSAKYNPVPLVIVEELKPQYQKALRMLVEILSPNRLGDYLEFGVCYGTSMFCMFETLKEQHIKNVRLFGFDSFEGLPASVANDSTNNWEPGEFACSLEFTSKNLTEKGIDWDRTNLIKGWYSETLTDDLKKKYDIKKASIIMVDCDLYSSAKEALNFCAPIIKDMSIIFFDDWAEEEIGEKKAFNEFLKENTKFQVEELGSYRPAGKIFMLQVF